MQLNDLPIEVHVAPSATAPDVFQQLGQLTRQLHDALNQLGVMPKIQESAVGLSDARSRLGYIMRKTGEAADKVLSTVELAKQEQTTLADARLRLTAALAVPGASAAAAALAFADEVQASSQRSDGYLTDIMLAQDFHDLTGQVVSKIIQQAMVLEDGMVKLLLQAAPSDLTSKLEVNLAGPVVDSSKPDVVNNQGEVDDLLASLGF